MCFAKCFKNVFCWINFSLGLCRDVSLCFSFLQTIFWTTNPKASHPLRNFSMSPMMRCPSGLRKREAKERSVQNCNDERLSSFLPEYILDLWCLSFCAHADVWHGARRRVLPSPEWEGEQTDRSRALWSGHLLSGYQIPRFILFYYYTSTITNVSCSLCYTQFVMHWNICQKINFWFRFLI